MSEIPKADSYGTAKDHGPTVIQARNNFVGELRNYFPRSSWKDAEAFLDHMIAARYLSDSFFAAWSHEEEGES